MAASQPWSPNVLSGQTDQLSPKYAFCLPGSWTVTVADTSTSAAAVVACRYDHLSAVKVAAASLTCAPFHPVGDGVQSASGAGGSAAAIGPSAVTVASSARAR